MKAGEPTYVTISFFSLRLIFVLCERGAFWNNWQLCAWHKGTELSRGDHLPSLGQSWALVIFSSPSSPIAYNRVTDKVVGGFFTPALGRGFQLSAIILQNSSTVLGWKVTLHPATQNQPPPTLDQNAWRVSKESLRNRWAGFPQADITRFTFFFYICQCPSYLQSLITFRPFQAAHEHTRFCSPKFLL